MAGHETSIRTEELKPHWQPYLAALALTPATVEHVLTVGACAEFARPGTSVAAEILALERAVLVNKADPAANQVA